MSCFRVSKRGVTVLQKWMTIIDYGRMLLHKAVRRKLKEMTNNANKRSFSQSESKPWICQLLVFTIHRETIMYD